MSAPRSFARRPQTPDNWVRADSRSEPIAPKADRFTARLTIDVTPELRGRIKMTAFSRGLTATDMLRELLDREFPDKETTT